jgi:hypothetical protein
VKAPVAQRRQVAGQSHDPFDQHLVGKRGAAKDDGVATVDRAEAIDQTVDQHALPLNARSDLQLPAAIILRASGAEATAPWASESPSQPRGADKPAVLRRACLVALWTGNAEL